MKVRNSIFALLVLFIVHPLIAQPAPPGIRPTPPVLPPPRPPARNARGPVPALTLPMRGTITKIEDGIFTVKMLPSETETARAQRDAADAKAATPPNAALPDKLEEKPAEKPPAERTFKVDATTRIFIGTVVGERKMPNGDAVRTIRMSPGAPGQLEVEQVISFALKEDQATAIYHRPELVVRAKDKAAATQPSEGKNVGE